MAFAAWQKRASRMATTGRPMGRPAKPVEQHRLAGNPSKRTLPEPPLPGFGITASSTAPKAPELGDHGLALWFHVWEAGRAWLSPDSDYTIVRLLCEATDEATELRRLLNSGEVERFYVTANGQVVSHPVVTQLASIRTQLSSWLAAIGFSPSDRSRLGLAEVRVRDNMDELKARRIDRATGA
jgi:P27 family predicted phage terminase small subunit